MKVKRKNRKTKRPETRTKYRSPDGKDVSVTRIRDLIEPLCDAEGMELVHIEYHRERGGRKLRFYIDKSGGVTLDDCVSISRQSGDLLDVILEDTGPYNLEVSSPGPERPLGKETDFERFRGRTARIKTTQTVDGRKKFKGVLMGISEGTVKLLVEDQPVFIPLSEISRARLVDDQPNFDVTDLTGR
ncbi:ribosome maturation factor RimP [Thermodesulfobacteriota bacterium]